ncbi:MAG: hypothetical protein QX199_07145 [Methylococcaceae bacterium]
MQTYLPLIKAMLSEWYLFTLNNALYAAALAITVWLLTAMLYSIRIGALKRGKIAEQKAAGKNLNAMQQQLQQSQEALAETVDQMEKVQRAAQDETQRALTLEQLVYQRNRQIAGIIQTLATSFDLGERPLLATEDVKADSLWQQHDKVITQLTERLRSELQAKIELQQTCQAETAKLAEKEALLKALQTTLNNHTNQLSKLELALEEQKSILQHQDNAQQLICDTLKKYQPDTVRAAEPESINIPQQPLQFKVSPDTEEILIAPPTRDDQAEPANEQPQTVVEPIPAEPVELITTVEDIAPAPLEIIPADEEAPSVSVDIEPQPVIPAKGSFGKIKNLFGKKQQPVKTEPQWTVAESETQSLPSDEDPLPVNTDDEASEKAKNKPGKLKGFYSKFASKGK